MFEVSAPSGYYYCPYIPYTRHPMKPNAHFVSPKTYLTGYTVLNMEGIKAYLEDTNQTDFLEDIEKAKAEGLNDGEILCSFYSKLCYASLVVGKNQNISKIRDIWPNIRGTIESRHGSVFEHCNLNFTVTNCSRIYTHEMVRHRVGTAFSQTSGRYVRTDELNVVIDPILQPIEDLVEEARAYLEDWYKRAVAGMNLENVKDFGIKKKVTSALRRMLPNGQANEIGVSLNLRSLRHTLELRTSEHAEWEIRLIFNQIYDLIKDKYPAMVFDAKLRVVEGLNEITFENQRI